MSVPTGFSSAVGNVTYPSLESVFGPILVGTLVSTMLYGITCVQAFDYFNIPNEDPRWQKFIVAVLLFLDTFDTVLNSHAVYYYLVKNFGNTSTLSSPLWSVSCRGVIHGLGSFIIRAMFARRVYLVSKKNTILCLWIMATSSAHLVMGILIMIKSFIPNSAALPSLTHLLYIAFPLGNAADISTACALYWLLRRMKTGIRRTDSLVKVLLLYVVTTCLLVVVDSTLGFILFMAKPNSLIYLGFYMQLGKLYTNAYLANLNARERLAKNQTDVVISLSQISNRNGQNRSTSATTYDKPSFQRSNNDGPINSQTSIEPKPDDFEIKN